MYKKLKTYLIGDAISNAQTIFDESKIVLMFNLIALYVVIYMIGSIPMIAGQYWLIVLIQLIGFSFIIAMAISLKSTGKIRLPRQIWFVSGIFFTMSSALLNSGEASYITYSFSIVNVVISFLILGRFLRNVALIYYIIFLTISVSIAVGQLPKIELPFDLTREHEFFDEPNIYSILIALAMIAFIIDSFLKSNQAASIDILNQKEIVANHKELLEKKHETIKLSIELAANIQAQSRQSWTSLETNFSDYFYLHIPKEKLSGEFFWEKQVGETVYFALVDTGEVDVPGAMFAFLVQNGLEKATQEKHNPTPQKILLFMNNFMKENLKTTADIESNLKISLCQYNPATKTLHLSGVSHPIIVQKEDKLKTYFPKNHHLNYLNEKNEFDEAKIKLNDNDLVFLFTDGVSDGSESTNGKAVDYSSFKSLVFNHLKNDFQVRGNAISAHFHSLKKEGKQKDDITIIGLKI